MMLEFMGRMRAKSRDHRFLRVAVHALRQQDPRSQKLLQNFYRFKFWLVMDLCVLLGDRAMMAY